MIVLPYLCKLSLQIRTRINLVMKNKLPTAIFELYSRLSTSWSIFLHSKTKFLLSYVLALFINLSAVAAMLSIMAKLSAILKSECVNALEFLLSLERDWKGITILPQKNIIYFAIIHLILTIFPEYPAITMTSKLP